MYVDYHMSGSGNDTGVQYFLVFPVRTILAGFTESVMECNISGSLATHHIVTIHLTVEFGGLIGELHVLLVVVPHATP